MPSELMKITDPFGGIDKEKAKTLGYEVKPGEDWIAEDVDILVPAALENQVTGRERQAHLPPREGHRRGRERADDARGGQVIQERGIFVIPDFLANAGGVTCSYFEQVQSNMNHYWTQDEVLGKLDVKMTHAFHDVAELAKSRKLYMRDAAYVIAVSRVAKACRDRGWV